MYNNYSEFNKIIEAITTPALLAIFGGIARACRYGVESWRQFCGSMVVSAFTGVLVHLMLQETGISTSTQAAIVAVSGYSGGALLDALASGIIQQLKQVQLLKKIQQSESQGYKNDEEKP